MENTIDTLKIKIDEARKLLPIESRSAIDSVNWKLTILEMNKKYSEEQLENLETETELLLCGILSPEDYLKEIENRMGISKEEANGLVNEMDKLIFQKIQTEFEKKLKIEEKSMFVNEPSKEEIPLPPYAQTEIKPAEQPRIVESHPIEPVIQPTPRQESAPILEQTKNTEPVAQPLELNKAPNILEEKLSRPTVNTETISNYSNPKVDPYREQF